MAKNTDVDWGMIGDHIGVPLTFDSDDEIVPDYDQMVEDGLNPECICIKPYGCKCGAIIVERELRKRRALTINTKPKHLRKIKQGDMVRILQPEDSDIDYFEVDVLTWHRVEGKVFEVYAVQKRGKWPGGGRAYIDVGPVRPSLGLEWFPFDALFKP